MFDLNQNQSHQMQPNQSAQNTNNPFLSPTPLTSEYVDYVVRLLEAYTDTFYSQPGRQNHDVTAWKEAQARLLQFQQITNPFEMCTEIMKKTQNSLVLYQATSCLKAAVTSEFRKLTCEQINGLFQFLYEFLCASAINNDNSVNETTTLTCAVLLKRMAIDKSNNNPDNIGESDTIGQIVNTLCRDVRNPEENLSKKLASALLLCSLIQDCHNNRAVSFGLKIWSHIQARRQVELHLRVVTESALETINWAFTSNVLNPQNYDNTQTKANFQLVATLIKCVENCLSFSSAETGCNTSGDRVLRVIQCRAINFLARANEQSDRLTVLREWCNLIMSEQVVQFLCTLYKTIKSMIEILPNWSRDVLKSSMNCLYYLADVLTSVVVEKAENYFNFIGYLMRGFSDLMKSEVKGVDDSFQIASLLASMSMYTSDIRETLPKLNTEYLIPFIETAREYTCKILTLVATTDKAEEEEEEERTVDTLLDFWYHMFKNIEQAKQFSSTEKLSADFVKTQARTIVEVYISSHLHKPIGILEPKLDISLRELNFDTASDNEDHVVHSQQLIAFGLITRIDALHTAKILIELFSSRLAHYEAFLSQYVLTDPSSDVSVEWERINDDLHWLLLFTQNYLTQSGFNEFGFMSDEVIQVSINYDADNEETIKAVANFDSSSPKVDPIVRLVILALKLCQIEMGLMTNNKTIWMSNQTNHSLTILLSKFCLSYLYPREQEYPIISPHINACFGRDSPTAKKFLQFIIEHSCCTILTMKNDPRIVSSNVQFVLQLFKIQQVSRDFNEFSKESNIITTFLGQMKPECIDGFSPKVAKSIMKLVAQLFFKADDWTKLIEFFTAKWSFIINSIQTNQHQSEIVVTKFLEFCDFCMGICEVSNEDTGADLFQKLIIPIVQTLPKVIVAFANYDNVITSIFELLYVIVKFTVLFGNVYSGGPVETFYEACKEIVAKYVDIVSKKVRKDEEEAFEDIIMVLTFSNEVMKRDWGYQFNLCEDIIKFTLEKMSTIIKPEYLEYPKIRNLYYKLLLYSVDEEERMTSLSDTLLSTIVNSILLALRSQFEKEVDNLVLTMITVICREIYLEKYSEENRETRLSMLMKPCLPALFESIVERGSYMSGTDSSETIGPAFFTLRCCYPDLYKELVAQLIQRQEDPYIRSKIETLFNEFEAKISKLGVSRSCCREFNVQFTPFLAELQGYTNFLTAPRST